MPVYGTAIRIMVQIFAKVSSSMLLSNALMTLNEYLEDYAKPETRAIGKALIQKELLNIPNEKVRAIAAEHIRVNIICVLDTGNTDGVRTYSISCF